MRMSGSAIELSASDLSGFLSCTHLTALDLTVARGERESPNLDRPGAHRASGAWSRG